MHIMYTSFALLSPEASHAIAKEIGRVLGRRKYTTQQIMKFQPGELAAEAGLSSTGREHLLALPVIPKWMNGKPGEPQQHFGLFLTTVAFYAAAEQAGS